jgi:hypothetical protein
LLTSLRAISDAAETRQPQFALSVSVSERSASLSDSVNAPETITLTVMYGPISLATVAAFFPTRDADAGEHDMRHYGIVRDGKTFIVQAEQQGVLKCASRRRAARTIADATDLMRADAAPNLVQAEAMTSPDDQGE